MIEAVCSGCGSIFSIDDSHAGKTGRCRKCGAAVSIPSAAEDEPRSPPPPPEAPISLGSHGEEGDSSPACQITTTDLIHGWSVTGYKGLVTAHVVAGTGFFSDFAASVTDVFGGRSRTYQRQMAAIEEEAIECLRDAAIERGANWVIGTRLDFDEISGKGMQMFMVSAQGTAVLAIAVPQQPAGLGKATSVPGTAVKDQIRKDDIHASLSAMQAGERPVTEEFLETLCEARLAEAVPLCLSVVFSKDEHLSPRIRQLARQALLLSPRRTTREALQELMLRSPAAQGVVELYSALGLLDLKWVRQHITSSDANARHAGLRAICECVAATYTQEDIAILRELATAIPRAFPETAKDVEVKSLLAGLAKKWRCEGGHDNSLEDARCSVCDMDRFGIRLRTYSPAIATTMIKSTLSRLLKHFRA